MQTVLYVFEVKRLAALQTALLNYSLSLTFQNVPYSLEDLPRELHSVTKGRINITNIAHLGDILFPYHHRMAKLAIGADTSWITEIFARVQYVFAVIICSDICFPQTWI